jgi:hypothetical protein
MLDDMNEFPPLPTSVGNTVTESVLYYRTQVIS